MAQDQADLETRIYNNYRAALRSQVGGRAASRRQAARKITVGRFGVSYAQVKEIVTRLDEVHGVTHEHTENYLRTLAVQRAQEEYDRNPVPCQCGSTDMVRVRPNPYTLEIHGTSQLTTLCYACYRVLEEDI